MEPVMPQRGAGGRGSVEGMQDEKNDPMASNPMEPAAGWELQIGCGVRVIVILAGLGGFAA